MFMKKYSKFILKYLYNKLYIIEKWNKNYILLKCILKNEKKWKNSFLNGKNELKNEKNEKIPILTEK